MRHALLLLILPTSAAALIAAACTTSSDTTGGDSDAGETVVPGTSGGTSGDPGTGTTPQSYGKAGDGSPTGLPCDVQDVIENRCIVCHGEASPPPLTNFNDLTAKSTADPTKTRAQLSLEYLKAKKMPPAPAVPAEDDEVAAFEAWINSGTAANATSCTTGGPAPGGDGGGGGRGDGGGGGRDGGAGDGGCTSNKVWDPASGNGELMEPGQACNACHARNGGPRLRIAGTVFLGLHDPNRCIGAAPPPQVTVTITDNKDKQIAMQVNASGNFYTKERFSAPIKKAEVTDGVKPPRVMVNNTGGDCNTCHTQEGRNNAPGRIQAP